MRVKRIIPLVGLWAVTLLGTADLGWAQQTIRCESDNGRYQYCRADTDNEVRLSRQLSSSACTQFRSWGYDKRGVWVDDGCRAEFRVGKGGGNEAIGAAAAIAGVAVLAAVLASKDHDDDDHANDGDQENPYRYGDYQNDPGAPSWAVGRFRGYNPRYGAETELTIMSSGKVYGRAGNVLIDGYWSNNQIVMDGRRFSVLIERNGFKTTDLRDRDNVVHYTRVR